MAKIKTPEEIVTLREAGRRLRVVLNTVKDAIVPGVTTLELDLLAEKLIRECGDTPPLKNYTPYGAKIPFPASLCVSMNDEIVHGIPSKDRIVEEGDIVSLDLCLTHNGMTADAALTKAVGKVPEEVTQLLKETERSLYAGIKAIRAGSRIGDIGSAIERIANEHGYGIVRELGGHGVGHGVHEDPYVPNFGKKGTGPILKPGMVIAIEPMFLLGGDAISQLDDGYTIISQDGSLSAHFEHTVVITKNGAEIMTQA